MTDASDLWLQFTRTHDDSLLAQILADDAIFESPVVFTPQRGKAITTMYLRAAVSVLSNFKCINTWRSASSTVLEFEASIDGIAINGVDIIAWNDDGKITHFKVMVRPLQAINILHKKMGELLAARTPSVASMDASDSARGPVG
jgi:hypothetical protein